MDVYLIEVKDCRKGNKLIRRAKEANRFWGTGSFDHKYSPPKYNAKTIRLKADDKQELLDWIVSVGCENVL